MCGWVGALLLLGYVFWGDGGVVVMPVCVLGVSGRSDVGLGRLLAGEVWKGGLDWV